MRMLSPFSLVLAVLLGACCYISYTIVLAPYLSPYIDFPRPEQPPLLFRLFHEPTSFEITQWVRTVPNDGFIRYFGLWNQERLIITTVEGYKELLLRDAAKYEKLAALAAVQWPVGVSGLVSSKGTLHKIHRRHTISAYNASWARTLYPGVWQTAQEATSCLAERVAVAPGRMLHINRVMRIACLEAIGRAGFSLDLGALANPTQEPTKSYLHGFDVGENTPLFLKLLQICPDPFKVLVSTVVSNWILRVDISKMEAVIRRTVASKIKALGDQKCTTPANRQLDLMDRICLRGQPQLSERSLARHALSALAASVEMVSNQLAWAVYALSLPEHQDIQDNLRAEICTRFPFSPETVTAEDMDALPYLNGVVNEVLRLYPSVPARFRVCHIPTILLGQAIRRNTLILWPIFSMNRDPDFWGPDADKLCPERWNTYRIGGQESSRRDAYAFMTFGQGTRKCAGEHYARVVIACLVISLVGRFRMTLPPGGDVLAGGREKVGFGIVMKAPISAVFQELSVLGPPMVPT